MKKFSKSVSLSCIIFILFHILHSTYIPAQAQSDKIREILQKANVKAGDKDIEVTIRSVEITSFPLIKIMIEAFNKIGQPMDTLTAENMFVYENQVSKKVISVERIPVSEKVPVDFMLAIDVTGSMQKYINDVMANIGKFTASLIRRGIDYRIGLVLFSDDIEKIYEPTDNVIQFMDWLSSVKAKGGGDESENALEALEAACKIKYRIEANKVAVIITDAPYHQKGGEGDGVTNQTTSSIIKLLIENEIRVFSLVPPRLTNYQEISNRTHGTFYDIDYPFSTILDNFSNQLTNLYYLTYRSDQNAVPDSIEIAFYNSQSQSLIRKTIPIVELGRKLIIENLLYTTNSFDLPQSVRELDILADFLRSKPNVRILIEGHTDNIGGHPLNDKLSLNRAESVKAYLSKSGISSDRIKTIGYGKRRPLASNKSEFGRRLNRRTEIVIVAN